ncbi:Crp/Fnr family transcriptional regulator [candidate division FCPU426 bacterium]|nr:Crp/Fnr family transcriptional regulator [candidate division FCPU426 bacterium]
MATAQEIFERYGKVYPSGTTIFKEGDIGEEMFIIQSGQVKITKKTNEGEKTLVILSEGDFFGEMAVIDREPRSASATAITETKCIVLNQEVFESTMQSNIHIVKKILRKMSSRLREANKQIENLLVKDHNRRVANTLALIAHKHGSQTSRGIVIDFPLTIRELADAAGLLGEMEKVKNILDKLAKAKIIGFEREQIVILSLENLEKFIKYLEMKEEFGE